MLPRRTPLITSRGDPRLYDRCDRIRRATIWLARQQDIPPLGRAAVMCVVHMPGWEQFDPAGWALTARAAMEGLGHARIIDVPADPDLRGTSGAGGKDTRFSIRVYGGGAAPPPPLSRKTRHQLENYFFAGGPLLSAWRAAELCGVNPRTVCRWRAIIREMGDTPWTFTTRPGSG
jgi:hypothetical protein